VQNWSKLKVTVLGCGTSTGVPVLGCQCVLCLERKPKNIRTRSSLMLEFYSTDHPHSVEPLRIVIDTGPDFRSQLLREHIFSLQHVIYTHCHADHLHGFDDLRGLYFNSQKQIHCYLDQDYSEELKQRFHYAFEDTGYLGGKPDLRLHVIKPGVSMFNIDDLTVESIQLPHGHVMTNAFRFGGFAYATDFKNFTPETIKAWKGKVSFMIASGLRWKPHKTHSTIEETLSLFDELQVETGIITHLNHEIDYDVDSLKLPKNRYLAYDGYSLEIPSPFKDMDRNQ
jgi:phosphoribosyl 1,2-cyclic phosphate phosphodiesterase